MFSSIIELIGTNLISFDCHLQDFLDNYVRRKVSKARLENWLYKPNTHTPQNSRSSSPGLLYSSSYGDNNGPTNGTQDTTNNVKHQRVSEPIQFWNNSMNSSSSRNSSYGRLPLMASTSNLPSIVNQSIKNPNSLHLSVSNKVKNILKEKYISSI